MAAPSNAKQDDAFFEMMLVAVLDDYGNIPLFILEEAINNGIRGMYSDGRNVSVTSITIFHWLRERISDYKADKQREQRQSEIEATIKKTA